MDMKNGGILTGHQLENLNVRNIRRCFTKNVRVAKIDSYEV